MDHLITKAVQTLKKHYFQETLDKSKGCLLYDDDIDDKMKTKLHSCWGRSETYFNWKNFLVCGAVCAIFVSTGAEGDELETFSRAKISLAIFILPKSLDTSPKVRQQSTQKQNKKIT